MKPQRLELDFLQSGRRPGRASWLLLAVAVVFSLDVCHSWYTLRTQVAKKEASASLRTSAPPRAEVVRVSTHPLREAELASARETLRRLSVPWSDLFSALEGAQTDRVWLLSIEPDVQNGTVALTGDALDYLAALSYVANLEQQKLLTGVHMVRHETRQNEAQRPVAFTIAATWKERR